MYLESLQEKDLYLAYKKTKFELFNDNISTSTVQLFEYEENLEDNIDKLYKNIKEEGLFNICSYSYYEIPKSYNEKQSEIQDEVHFFSSSLIHHKGNKQKNIELKFRKIIDANINFHIISTLWIDKIGQYIDEKLSHDVYGSRLVRIKPVDISSCEYDLTMQSYNLESPRIFEPYQYKYQKWRNNSFNTIRELHKSSSVIAVTMDITSFYHQIDIEEFISKEFYDNFGLSDLFEDNDELKIFHEDFIALLKKWNSSINSEDGLPIGISASPILANAVMKEFDNNIENKLKPTYYGRYVDDILLVFPDSGNIRNGEDVIRYLISKDIVKRDIKKDPNSIFYKKFTFKKNKQKIFYLDRNSDLSIIDAIESEINSISSEWRFMPDLVDDNSTFLQKIIGFYADGNEFNDALRKVDSTTIKKLGLSLLIGHAHSLNEYISPSEWKNKRHEIYDLIENHIFIPSNFFNNYMFISRIFKLMIHSGDGERAYCFLEKTISIIDSFREISSKNCIASNGKDVEFYRFEKYHYSLLQQVFLETCNILSNIKKRHLLKIINTLFNQEVFCDYSNVLITFYNRVMTKEVDKEGLISFDNLHIPATEINEDVIKEINAHLFFRDLAFNSFSSSCTEYVLTKNNYNLLKMNRKFLYNRYKDSNLEIKLSEEDTYLLVIDNFKEKIIEGLSNSPFLFPTRVFSANDISIVSCMSDGNQNSLLKAYVNCLRGNHNNYFTDSPLDNNNKEVLTIPYKKFSKSDNINIAITNFKVDESFWKKSVIKKPVKSLSRYLQLERIIKDAVKKKPDYLILPELSIPQEWAWRISKKLLSNGISLITGVEYIHSEVNSQKYVHNPIMMFLISDDIGFKYMKYFRQDKQVGAHGESFELKKIANIELIADKLYKKKYIYSHGDFFFSCLICNELTDIENRMRLRGNIDTLFIVEWNKDIKSFNSLVESASLDIHSYIVQVNNRKYGDSRIRAPFKDDFKRDIVQVKGGKHDYLIVGEINVNSLRNFQSHNISPSVPFKPVPTGFKMLKARKKWENEIKEDL